jgi:hypothetical protein
MSWIFTPSQPRLTLPPFSSLHDLPHGLGGHRESDADIAARWAVDRRVHADDVALEIEGRTAGVAVVHRGVDLHEVVRPADVARERGHDAGRHGAAETERIAHGQHPVPDAGRLLCELDRDQRFLRLDLEERDIGARRCRRRASISSSIVEADFHLRCAIDHVPVGHDVAVRRDDEAGPGRLPRPLLRDAVRQVLEELVQRMVLGKARKALEVPRFPALPGAVVRDLRHVVRRRNADDRRLHLLDDIGKRQRLRRNARLQLSDSRRRPVGETKRQQAGAQHCDRGETPQIAARRFGWPGLCFALWRAGMRMHAHEPPFCVAENILRARWVSEIGITAAFRLP